MFRDLLGTKEEERKISFTGKAFLKISEKHLEIEIRKLSVVICSRHTFELKEIKRLTNYSGRHTKHAELKYLLFTGMITGRLRCGTSDT